jgi:hypothetical protein
MMGLSTAGGHVRGGARRPRWTLWLACLAVVLCSARSAAADEIIERMLAVVAGDLITMSDVAAAVEFGLVPQTSGTDVTRVVLSQLIDRSLMLAEVDRYAPGEPSVQLVNQEWTIVQNRYASAESFQKALDRFGIDEESLRETLRANLRLRAYLEQRFSSAPPSEEEVLAYYRSHVDRFTRDGQVQPLDQVEGDVVQAIELDGRQLMVNDWLAGLRRRATIADVYISNATAPLVR